MMEELSEELIDSASAEDLREAYRVLLRHHVEETTFLRREAKINHDWGRSCVIQINRLYEQRDAAWKQVSALRNAAKVKRPKR